MNFSPLIDALDNIEVESFEKAIFLIKSVRFHYGKLIFIGNGGSAAIASHMAIDFQNKGHVAAMALNEAPALTCIGNDYGYEWVFSAQLSHHFCENDVLFAVSSSGESHNILNAVSAVNDRNRVVTLSGFSKDNHLRKAGIVNFYVPSNSYAVVETAHLAILHSLLESICE